MNCKKCVSVLLALLLLLVSLPACRPATVQSEGDRAEIYAAVVRQLYTVDHTFGDNPPNWPVVYLLRATNDRAGNPVVNGEVKSSAIPVSVQEAIVAALEDLPAKLTWIDDQREVIDERISGVINNGALVTLGNIYLQEDGSVQVAASIYFSSLGAGGTTYVVKKVAGVWQITGKTGAQWIS